GGPSRSHPAKGRDVQTPAAPGAARRDSVPPRALRGQVLPTVQPRRPEDFPRDHGSPEGIRLAGECPRTGEHDQAGGGAAERSLDQGGDRGSTPATGAPATGSCADRVGTAPSVFLGAGDGAQGGG